MAEKFIPPTPDQWEPASTQAFVPPSPDQWEPQKSRVRTPQETKAFLDSRAPGSPPPKWKTQPWKELAGGFNDTMKTAAQAVAPKNWKNYATDILLGPAARPAVSMLGAHVDQARKSVNVPKGRYSYLTATGHALAAVTPGGPFVAEIGETLPDNPLRALGMAGAGATMAAAPRIVGPMARGSAQAGSAVTEGIQGLHQKYGSEGRALSKAVRTERIRRMAKESLDGPPSPTPYPSGKGTKTKFGGPPQPFDEGARRLPPRTPATLPPDAPPPPLPEPFKKSPRTAALTRYGGSTEIPSVSSRNLTTRRTSGPAPPKLEPDSPLVTPSGTPVTPPSGPRTSPLNPRAQAASEALIEEMKRSGTAPTSPPPSASRTAHEGVNRGIRLDAVVTELKKRGVTTHEQLGQMSNSQLDQVFNDIGHHKPGTYGSDPAITRQQIAIKLGAPHRYRDPNIPARARGGVVVPKAKRKGHWYGKPTAAMKLKNKLPKMPRVEQDGPPPFPQERS